jgi:hypothetical protein
MIFGKLAKTNEEKGLKHGHLTTIFSLVYFERIIPGSGDNYFGFSETKLKHKVGFMQ